MLRCAPYIKSLCNSLNSHWLSDGVTSSSLPGSPVKRAVAPSPTRSEGGGVPASTSDDGFLEDDDEDERLEIISTVTRSPVISLEPQRTGAQRGLANVHISSLVANSTAVSTIKMGGSGGVITTVINQQPRHKGTKAQPGHETVPCKSRPIINALDSESKKVSGTSTTGSDLVKMVQRVSRSDSPDVTSAAKKTEIKKRHLGAIAKIPARLVYHQSVGKGGQSR